jgi:hypothetical protein
LDTQENRTWRTILEVSLPNRLKFKRWFVRPYGALVFGTAIWAIVHSWPPWVTGLAALMASFIPVFLFGWRADKFKWRVNGRSQLERFDPRRQSMAYLADTYGLAPMAIFATLAWPHLPHNVLFTGNLWPLWAVISGLAGIGLSKVFLRGEGKVFNALSIITYGKIAHNGVAFSVLGGLIVFTMIPIIFFGGLGSSHWAKWAVVGFALWLVSAMLIDGQRGPTGLLKNFPLDPNFLHPPEDEKGHTIPTEELAKLGHIPMWNEVAGIHVREPLDVSDSLQTWRIMEMVSDLLKRLLTFRRPKGASQPVVPPRPDMLYDENLNDDGPPKDGPDRPD